ncbi:hypothetical protein MKK75_17965 [Methylobacterium sp. J-030]|uniref:hypothetical protein n=1 Tax=Methylobacterium sp. J-030 TaxID=2836627 RepID=UPI001FBB1856|nr:hypothetical protein [Methylobacterium sp. J-030]MCJ2070654.1 hypothetical protein [Methylobacterium sp. J-030]
MKTKERELECSPLSGHFTRDGVTVEVKIYRFAGTDDPWQLEVLDHEGSSTAWDDPFPTPQDAIDALNKAVEEEGMAAFVVPLRSTIH